MKALKATNQDPFLLRRKLTIHGLDDSQWDDLIHELKHHPCVDHAEYRAGNQLRVTYDGSHWSTDDLLQLIEARGGRPDKGWWTRQKLAWYRFTDDNVRANARHEPFCCSKVPSLKRK